PPHNVYTDTAGLLLQELREAGLQFVKLPELKPDIPEPLGLLYMRRPDSEEPYEKR
ncbi:hypothetical protein HY256_01810, partial [Candidatus Sumerlaeota bacterium]|nr:hypothetical protein [Candidatus Sumerlaeota bacterium]